MVDSGRGEETNPTLISSGPVASGEVAPGSGAAPPSGSYDVPLLPARGQPPKEGAKPEEDHYLPIVTDGAPSLEPEKGRLNLRQAHEKGAGVPIGPTARPSLDEGRGELEKESTPAAEQAVSSPSTETGTAGSLSPENSQIPPRRRGGDSRLAEFEASLSAEEADSSGGFYPEGRPISDAEVESWRGGYFPTQDDSVYIGDRDYPRSSRGNATTDPDRHSQNFNGIFPYESPDPTFYDHYDYVFDPLDRTLGFFAPHQALVWESQRYHEFSFMADAGLDLFTRAYDPDRAHVKMGPLYFDLLSMGAGVLYSDYRGVEYFPEGEEDGWLSFVDLQIRAVMQFTETFYLIVSGHFVYLPGDNEFGFYLGDGFGPYSVARLNYQARLREWDVLVYDELRVRFGGDLFWDAYEPAFERAGRYSFGFNDRYRNNSYFDDENMALSNKVAVNASRPLGPDWRLWLEADHTDYWRSYDFVDHGHWDHLGALIGYEGSELPFSPYLEYDAYSADTFETSYHTAYLGARGRLSENLRLNARGGRFWSVGREPEQESWVWDVGLTHDVNERTWQRVEVGQGYFIDEFSDDSALSQYASYSVGYRVTEWAYATAYAQWSEDEFLTGRGGEWQREIYGGNLNFRLLDYTSMDAGAAYERRRSLPDQEVDEHRLYYAGLSHQLYSRTQLWFRYQFEDAESFDESLYTAGIRRYF